MYSSEGQRKVARHSLYLKGKASKIVSTARFMSHDWCSLSLLSYRTARSRLGNDELSNTQSYFYLFTKRRHKGRVTNNSMHQ